MREISSSRLRESDLGDSKRGQRELGDFRLWRMTQLQLVKCGCMIQSMGVIFFKMIGVPSSIIVGARCSGTP